MTLRPKDIMDDMPDRIRKAVAHYWQTRTGQLERQRQTGKVDQGLRSAVTGGAQMDGFINLFTDLVVSAGIPREYVHTKRAIELPGFFRPTKEWDLLVVRDETLLVAIEAKSQVGPSFGNNFNNRTEEAMGSALDLWTAYREKAYLDSPQPFIGYFFMIEDCPSSNRPVKVKEPHFKVRPEFVGASYIRRYEIFCRKLVLERHYTSSAFISSTQESGIQGQFATPTNDLSVERFAKTLIAHVAAFV
ncbi:MAG: Type-2 restriction enzyme PaeR7I [Candidatus Hydrogenedentes bacterium ADurb.Bin179]|nr:MAG: Type-2 restriction enzyme PaeR7I [Candidatus Hydrogenedentes bacterium ADurb.Bin179]